MSKSAIVTGASAGIGSEISKALCGLGFEVFGIGREFKEPAEEQLFHPIVCDLLDTQQLLQNIKDIAARGDVSVLVNNAGVAYYGLHEELNPKKIQQMVRTNLEVPMILTQQLLRHLKANRGFVINISSVTAQSSSPHGCAMERQRQVLPDFPAVCLTRRENMG